MNFKTFLQIEISLKTKWCKDINVAVCISRWGKHPDVTDNTPCTANIHRPPELK